MKSNKQNFSKNYPPAAPERSDGGRGPFIILIALIIILLISAIIITWSKRAISNLSQSSQPNNTQIEIIDGNGDLPILSPSKQSEDNFSSIQSDPATIQDLGGDSAQPGSIEELLQDKEIDIKK